MPDNTDSLTEYVRKLEAENQALADQKQALIQEFRSSLPDKWSAADIRKKLREEILPQAYTQYVLLLNNAESEAVRAGLIKFAFQYVRDSENKTGESDEKLAELLAALAAND